MLTLANFNTTQAKTYYKRENYYSQEEAQANSEWRGQGASKHQLSGAIDDLDAYENIVNGLSPDGKTQLRQKQNHKDKKERAGVDLTFSAPKSVSIACLVGGDSRLEEAHRIAVRRTIDLIEERYAFTRINDERVKTGNLIVAVWHHDTSRELDPHLHSHCLLMNCTQSPDGKWRSISNEEFFRNKILLGQIYRNELALECKKLGYEIEPHPKELFEIKGYTREQIEAFSKRHEQIKEKLAEIGLEETTENKIWAWRKTRAKKNHEIDRQEMLPYWDQEADLYGITHPIAANPSPQLAPLAPPEEIEAELVAAVQAGIEHCSERKVAFRSEDIEKFVTAETRPFGISKLQEAIARHPELIKTFDGRYTTQAALARELATIKLMQQGKGAINPVAHPEAVEHYLEGKTITQGQREAIALTATTADQFIAWQGVAGAGKTYALNELKQIATALLDVALDYAIKGFAPSAEAAKVLEEELGIEANTVARLLVSKQSEPAQPNQIWIVDEAGLLSAKAAHELLQRATSERARVILVGDTRQLSAIEAGNPFKSLQQAGIQTAHLDESLRQKAPDLQLAVNLAAAGQITEAITHLEQVNRIEEIPDVGERTSRIATEYIKLSPQERQNTLILAGTHKEQRAIVKEIRAALKQEGTLGYEVEATKLKALDLTSVQARYTHHYNIGDVVVPLREYRRSGLHKSQPYTVEAIAKDKLTLSDVAGNYLTIDPMKFRKTVYKQEAIEIAVGDCLKWTRNDKELSRRNGQEFTVVGIEGQTATIEYLDGLSDRIDLTQPLHCDYALVSTTYSSQGKTADRVLISSTVDPTVSQESVYVAISRAKHDLKIFAEDRKFLFEQAEESNAQETVLELLQPQPLAQAAQPAPARVKQGASLSVGVTEKPNVLCQEKSPTPNIEKSIHRSRIPHQVKLTEPPQPKQKIKHSKPIERPKPLEAFWVPGNAGDAPLHIEEKHWHELVEGSAIHPAIASRNFRSLGFDSIERSHEAWEYLMYSDKLERLNTGRLSSGMLNRYAHIEAGGWWCSAGVDARSFTGLQLGQKPSEQIWGCYKPDAPRENIDKPGKKIKYEHPPKTDLSIFLLEVPDDIAERIYNKAGVDPEVSDRASGFWYCIWKHNLPVTLTEGAKKAGSLLSQGHAAIGLPGIYAGYRSKDEQRNEIKAHLHNELAVFATPGREIRFCFDFETRSETKRNIEIAISRTGSLLQQQSAKVKVISLPGPEKGVDDFIVANSPLAYEQQHLNALQLQQWRVQCKQQRQAVEPPKILIVDERKVQLKAKFNLQQLNNQQNLSNTEEKTHDFNSQQLETEPTAERRSFISRDRISDTERGRFKSSKRRSLRAKQGLAGGYAKAIKHNSVDSEGDVRRLHRPVQASVGGTEIRQNEQFSQRVERGNEQSLGQTREYKHGTASSQRAGAGGLRRNYGQEEANSAQRTEAAAHAIGEWSTALTDLAQSVQSVNDEQSIEESGLNLKLAALTQRIAELNSEPRQYQFEGLSELAGALIQQEAEHNLGEGLTQIQATLAQLTLVPNEVIDAAALIDELRPQTEQLVQAIHNWQSERQVSQAISVVHKVVQQLQQGQAFDFGVLAESVNSVTEEQLLTATGLEVKLADIAQQLEEFTVEVPTQFEGMSELVENLQSVQAESQLLKEHLTDQVAALTDLIGHFSNKPHEYEFEGITEIAQLFSQQQTQTSLSNTLEEIAELALNLERRKAFTELAQTVHLFNVQQQCQDSGLPEQLQAISERITGPNKQIINHKFKGINELAETLYERQAAQVFTEGVGVEQLQHLVEKIRHTGLSTTAQSTMTPPTSTFTPPRKLTNPPRANQDKQAAFKSHANSVRDIPIEEVAERLGLERDLRDKHKWKGVGQTISINGQKFYDHLEQKGGYGAIDLVMHVQGRNFKESVDWLSNGINELPTRQERSQRGKPSSIASPQILQERQPFQPPIPDKNKWQEVKQYLVQQRGLPVSLVDELHSSGKIYAAGLEPEALQKLSSKGYSHPEAITNAVFLRHNLAQEPTGASLRGVSEGSSFKGLATGSNRDNGWFSFTTGEGQLERIVLVESAIDAMSAAALAKQPGKTMFISTDGAGSVPVDWLQQQQAQGIQIIAAHDADRAGEEMAWRLAAEVPAITRAIPNHGKDWNEQLKGNRQPKQAETLLDHPEWQRVAQAIGKPIAYIERIKAVTEAGKALPGQAKSAMQQDFQSYRQTSTDLWQWHQAVKTLGESESYLKRIADVALAFHHSKQPIPLQQKAMSSMQQDLLQYERLLTQKLWQRYSQNADLTRPVKTAGIVAIAALIDGHSPERIQKILEHDPEVTKIRQRAGENAAQKHLAIAMRNAEYRRRSPSQPQQLDKQRQQKQEPGLQL